MESEPMQPNLDDAQKRLEAALEEACAVDPKDLDTGELIRMEETLASASKAAKDAVSVRLRMRSHSQGADVPSTLAEREADSRETGDEPVTRRAFDDVAGVHWQAFAVHPSTPVGERSGLPERFRGGWLSFESENEMRRVAPIPFNWEQLSIDELRELCQRGEKAPKRINALDLAAQKRPKP